MNINQSKNIIRINIITQIICLILIGIAITFIVLLFWNTLFPKTSLSDLISDFDAKSIKFILPTCNSITLQWKAGKDVFLYVLDVQLFQTNGTQISKTTIEINADPIPVNNLYQYEFDDLPSATKINVTINTYDKYGRLLDGPFGITGYTPGIFPLNNNFIATDYTATSTSFQWNHIPSATSYQLIASVTPGLLISPITIIPTADQVKIGMITCDVDNLKDGFLIVDGIFPKYIKYTYKWKLIILDNCGNSQTMQNVVELTLPTYSTAPFTTTPSCVHETFGWSTVLVYQSSIYPNGILAGFVGTCGNIVLGSNAGNGRLKAFVIPDSEHTCISGFEIRNHIITIFFRSYIATRYPVQGIINANVDSPIVNLSYEFGFIGYYVQIQSNLPTPLGITAQMNFVNNQTDGSQINYYVETGAVPYFFTQDFWEYSGIHCYTVGNTTGNLISFYSNPITRVTESYTVKYFRDDEVLISINFTQNQGVASLYNNSDDDDKDEDGQPIFHRVAFRSPVGKIILKTMSMSSTKSASEIINTYTIYNTTQLYNQSQTFTASDPRFVTANKTPYFTIVSGCFYDKTSNICFNSMN